MVVCCQVIFKWPSLSLQFIQIPKHPQTSSNHILNYTKFGLKNGEFKLTRISSLIVLPPLRPKNYLIITYLLGTLSAQHFRYSGLYLDHRLEQFEVFLRGGKSIALVKAEYQFIRYIFYQSDTSLFNPI